MSSQYFNPCGPMCAKFIEACERFMEGELCECPKSRKYQTIMRERKKEYNLVYRSENGLKSSTRALKDKQSRRGSF